MPPQNRCFGAPYTCVGALGDYVHALTPVLARYACFDALVKVLAPPVPVSPNACIGAPSPFFGALSSCFDVLTACFGC